MVYSIVLTFFFYSFIGYISEVMYCSIGKRRFINRGFLFGPCIPIYGFGGIAISIFLTKMKSLPYASIWIFLSSGILASIIEYIGSWGLEKMFGIKLWDYSKRKFNIDGRICLRNSLLFGLMGLLAVYFIENPLSLFLSRISLNARRIASIILLSLFSIDFIFSTMKMSSFRNALYEISNKARILRCKRRHLTSVLRNKLDGEFVSYVERVRRRHRRIINSFPGATSRLDGMNESIKTLRDKERDVMERIKKLKR